MARKKLKKPFSYLLFGGGIVLAAGLISLALMTFLKLDFRITPGAPAAVTDNAVSTDNNYLLQSNLGDELTSALAANFNSDYDVTPTTQAKGTVRIPVLTWHHIDDLGKNPKGRDYYVSPKVFEQELAYLQEKNYKTLTPQEFYDQVKSGQNPVQKSVMLTFDDGNVDNYTNAFPLLKKYGFIGVFFVPSNKRGINNAQLKEMSNAGMIIASHGKTHMLLSKITDPTLLYQEITESKINIEAVTGQKVISFCYPGCEYNSTVISTIASSGYQMAFTCGYSIDQKLSRRFTIERLHVYNDMNHFKSILSGKTYYPTYSD